MIMADRRVMEHYIATEFGISHYRIHAVIHKELHMSKVSAHCVPKLLGSDLKRTRLNMARGNLVIGSQQFSSKICDYGWDLGPSFPFRAEATVEAEETHRFSASRKSHDCYVRKQGDGLHVLGCRSTVGGLPIISTGGDLLRLLIKRIRRGKLPRGVLFHQDNAPTYTPTVAMATIQKYGIQLVEHPPYSPDLTASD